MNRRKSGLALMLALLLFLLSGCVSSLPRERNGDGGTLPGVRSGPQAMIGDSQMAKEHTAVLYIPEADGSRLTPHVQEIVVPSGQTKQEAYIVALLEIVNESAFNTTNQTLRLSAVSNAVETTKDIATVNLHTSVRFLPDAMLFALRMAIINTLTALPETNYVNILINGRDIGQDIAEPVPTGVMARYPGNDVTNYWNQLQAQRASETGELQRTAALYFVSSDGQYLLGEARNISFGEQTVAEYATELIDALSKGPVRIAGARTAVPSLDYFARDPMVTEVDDSLYVELRLLPEVEDYLRVNRGSLSMTLSSICYTLTGFIPMLGGIIVYVGDELVTEMVLMNGDPWTMQNGQITRESVLALAADVCTVYYPLQSGAGLYAVTRPIAQRLRTQPRALLRELMTPPQQAGLARALPEAISDADILGLQIQDDTALVNVTAAFAQACQGLSSTQERNLVYAVVNTLTELEGIARVRFFVEGEQQSLAGHMFMEGEFLRHTGLIYSGTL